MLMRYCSAVLVLAAVSVHVRAEIYECADQDGNKRFTNIAAEAKGCKVLNVGPVNTMAPVPAKTHAKGAVTPTPANFPRVDPQTQQQRDGQRRRILEQELSREQQQLEAARKALAEQEGTRNGSERNYQRVLERLEPYKNKVKVHEDNVANLQRELANTR